MFNESMLRQFTGTERYYRWSPLFRLCVLTDGSKYLAENAGAYWLMDAIASHQPEALKNEKLQYFQLWTLKVTNKSAILTCREDSGHGNSAKITQKIKYTDFPLDEINLYCNPLDEKNRVILLQSEY